MNHTFDYDGQSYEAELDVIPGSPGVPASMDGPGEQAEAPTLELKSLWRVVGRGLDPVGAESRSLWREIEEFLNEDAEHIVGQANKDAKAEAAEARFDSKREG
jgi:hypothetical protein